MTDNKKPVCQLIGEDGNVFAIIGRVRAALKRAGQEDKAKEFTDRATTTKCLQCLITM